MNFKALSPLAVWLAGLTTAMSAYAQSGSIAHPWQLGMQEPASPVMDKMVWLHNHFLLYIITVITIFVVMLTLYICVRFSRRANPVPSKTTHNTKLEVIWTVLPVIILVVIAIPSVRAHYFKERVVDAEMTLKIVGHQWYWSYEYPDFGDYGFDSYMIKDEDLKEGQHRLLETDNRVVVPVDTTIRVQLTSADVIHAWAIPAFGVKQDAVPGRLNETWFRAEKTGVFYGQCSELCGVGHGFMPINVEVVSKEDFKAWIAGKQKEAGITPPQAEGKASTSPEPQKPIAQPKVAPKAPANAETSKQSGGVPNVGNTETNPQPDRKADAPAKKAAAKKKAGTATETEESPVESNSEESPSEEQ